MKVLMSNNPIPDELPEGSKYFLFKAERPDHFTLLGVFIGKDPSEVKNVPMIKECPPGTGISVGELTKEDYYRFVRDAAEAKQQEEERKKPQAS